MDPERERLAYIKVKPQRPHKSPRPPKLPKCKIQVPSVRLSKAPSPKGYRSLDGKLVTVLSGMAIRQLREAEEWTLDDMRKKVGMTLSGYHKVETGNVVPYFSTVVAIAEALGTTVDELLVHIPIKDLAEDGLPVEPV